MSWGDFQSFAGTIPATSVSDSTSWATDASRKAYMLQERQAQAEATGPSAWVPGPNTPSRGGLSAYTEQPTADAEAEASL